MEAGPLNAAADLTLRVEMIDIRKNYGVLDVLKGVSLQLAPGEVIGLVGDNAAGKSTLMKVLSGAVIADSGSILIDGVEADIGGPRDSRNLGIEMVYQDLALCDDLDVAANLFLGREQYHPITRRLNKKAMHLEAAEYLRNLHIRVTDTHQLVGQLSGGQRQAIAIARAVTFDPKVLILDEPTAALAAKEVATVLELIRNISKRGVAVILITHRLQDLYEVADRFVVLYEGTIDAELDPKQTSLEQLVMAMMGQVQKT
jgi:simple sugar transport system ATP-binding protein